jgi:hypothetical protein
MNGDFVAYEKTDKTNFKASLPYEDRKILDNAEEYEKKLTTQCQSDSYSVAHYNRVEFEATVKKYFTYKSDKPYAKIRNFALIQHNNNDISVIFSLTCTDDGETYYINHSIAKKMLFAGFSLPDIDSIYGPDFKFYARLSVWGIDKINKLLKMLCNFCIIEDIKLIKKIMDTFNIIASEYNDQGTNILLETMATEMEEGLDDKSFVGHAEENPEYLSKLNDMIERRQISKARLTDRLNKIGLLTN